MGSSKKHKDKDRERRHKHRKHRSHDRSRSRSKGRRHGDGDQPREKREDRKRKREEQYQRDEQYEQFAENQELTQPPVVDDYNEHSAAAAPPSPVYTKHDLTDEDAESFAAMSTSGGGSLTIQQTNELRAKLGLKPLEADDSESQSNETSSKSQDVHAPAANLTELKKTAALREKMAAIREKRRVNAMLGKIKTLGESDDEGDSAAAWVMRSRQLDEDRRLAEQRAQMLEEMDSEFGIGSLIEEEFGSAKKQMYTSKDLKGLRVEHDQQMIKEGKSVILTLKDKGVLDEDADDTLINVNIIDDERAAKNVENKKKKPGYQAYDDSEFDEYGTLKVRDVLEKYDEVIHGDKKESFELDDKGKYDTEYERQMQHMKATLHSQAERLTLPPPTVASEFFTHAEMEEAATFKKVTKKKRKLRKKVVVTADDLLGLEDDAATNLGSRKRPRLDGDSEAADVTVKTEPLIPGLDLADNTDIKEEDILNTDDVVGPDEDLTGVVVDEDTAALELELALSKARRLNQSKSVRRQNERDIVMARPDDVDEPAQYGSSIELNSTSEFCRSLGEIPTLGLAGNRDDDDDEMSEYDRDQLGGRDNHDDDDDMGAGGTWQSVQIDSRPVDITTLPEKSVLDEEPVLNHGLAGALELATKKGYLDMEKLRKSATFSTSVAQLKAQNYSIEDKKLEEGDDKHSRKRERYIAGGSMEFREKVGYKPEVKIEYVDEAGRQVPPKEAFRYLSHRFHGKGSGKKKLEKRIKKIEEDQLMRSMSSTDTPLNTVHLLQEKQKADKLPYIVLSGGKGIAANTIAK